MEESVMPEMNEARQQHGFAAGVAAIEQFGALDIRAGAVVAARVHPTARKSAFQLEIDFGPLGIRRSSAQITALYSAEELVGRQVIAVVNLPPRRVAGFTSEVLVLGALAGDGAVVLLTPERPVANGDRIA